MKIVVAVLILIGILIIKTPHVYAGQVTLRPSSDPAAPVWQTYPTNNQSRWAIIDRSDLSINPWICSASGTGSDLYDLTDASVGQGATAITIRAYTYMGSALVLANSSIALNGSISGALIGTTSLQNPPSSIGLLNNCTSTGGSYAWRTITYNGTWSQSQINALKLYLGRQAGLLDGPIRVAQAEAVIDYTDPPSLTQSAYRVYQNADSTTPGAPLASTNSPAEMPAGSTFRVRLGETVGTAAWSANFSSNKLQYTLKNQSTCASSTGWSDVQAGSGAVRWNDNPTPTDGALISSFAQDPTTSGTKTYEQYRESNNATDPNAVPLTNVAVWDFSLQAVGGSPGTAYCFRMANTASDIAFTYSQYPEVLLVGDLDIDMVDASGTSVPNPTISFGPLYALIGCQQSTTTLGTSSQKVRITNNLVTNGWTASIAATDGPTALWQSNTAHYYDYNDPSGSPPGCSAGLDSDIYAGWLSLNPGTSTITPAAGCTNTGITAGGSGGFQEGVNDVINLASGSSLASRFCSWDITGVSMKQQIPAAQAAGTYQLDLTATVVAQ